MTIFIKKINYVLQKKDLSYCKIAKLIDEYESSLISMIKRKRPFTEKAINKLLPVLEISRTEFESWILADKYSKEVLKLAVQAKKDFPYKKKLILTTNIDNILKEKGISRTVLSKEIKYGQSGLNQIITGKRTMPKSVLERLSIQLEISQDQILSWIVADSYSLQILENTCGLL